MFFAFSLRFLCVWGARGSFVFFFFFAFSLRCLCVSGARGSERLWKCKNPRRCCLFFAFSLPFSCIFFALSLRLGRPRLFFFLFLYFFFFAFSLRCLCVSGARGSERLWKCKNPRRCCVLCIFFAFFLHFLCVVFASGAPEARFFLFLYFFFLHFLCFFLHFLCVFFASGALEARRGSGKAGNAKNLGGVACFLHFLCVFFASGAPEARFFFFFAFSLRCLCVSGARGSERLWKCKNPRRCCVLCIFFAFFLHFLCVVFASGAPEALFFLFLYFFFFCIFFAFFCIFFACSLRLGRPRLGEALGRLEMPKT